MRKRDQKVVGKFMHKLAAEASEPLATMPKGKVAVRCIPVSKATGPNPKDLVGAQKVSITKVPAVAILHCAHAMMDGAYKYGPYNWRDKSIEAHIFVDAAMRHLLDWFEGAEHANDSLAHHLGHAMACSAILLDAMHNDRLIDDRPFIERGRLTQVFEELKERIAKMPSKIKHDKEKAK